MGTGVTGINWCETINIPHQVRPPLLLRRRISSPHLFLGTTERGTSFTAPSQLIVGDVFIYVPRITTTKKKGEQTCAEAGRVAAHVRHTQPPRMTRQGMYTPASIHQPQNGEKRR